MNAIAAVDRRWGIGRDGRLLQSVPEDMEYFRRMTLRKAVIMGRKTLESFPGKRPLKNRLENIVLTTRRDLAIPGVTVVHSAEEACARARAYAPEDVFVIGGGEVYRAMLPFCSRAYITKLDGSWDADTFFPDLDADPDWILTGSGGPRDCPGLKYEFTVYERTAESPARIAGNGGGHDEPA